MSINIEAESSEKFLDLVNGKYSKKEVQKAGEFLLFENVATEKPEEYSRAMQVLSYWRACHIYPLDIVVDRVQETALKVDRNVVIARRLKRTPSIINKLRRFDTMKLRNMQDIGGCRAIVSTIKRAIKLKRELNRKRSFRVVDYIENPKDDGYRGIHLIGKFPGKNKIDTYSIEIQIRTRVQHAWATAVEIIDLFTNQALKSNQGEKDWKDFFKNISNEFSKLEGVDNAKIYTSAYETSRLARKLSVRNKFEAYSHSLKILDSNMNDDADGFFIIIIDLRQKSLTLKFFEKDNFQDATQEYLNEEKKSAKIGTSVVALVSTNSIKDLKEAYPNYFADSTVFLELLNLVLSFYENQNPNWIKKLFLSAG